MDDSRMASRFPTARIEVRPQRPSQHGFLGRNHSAVMQKGYPAVRLATLVAQLDANEVAKTSAFPNFNSGTRGMQLTTSCGCVRSV